MTWAMTLLPIALLVLGFPIFIVLLATAAVVILLFSEFAARGSSADYVREHRQIRVAGRAVLYLRG